MCSCIYCIRSLFGTIKCLARETRVAALCCLCRDGGVACVLYVIIIYSAQGPPPVDDGCL